MEFFKQSLSFTNFASELCHIYIFVSSGNIKHQFRKSSFSVLFRKMSRIPSISTVVVIENEVTIMEHSEGNIFQSLGKLCVNMVRY